MTKKIKFIADYKTIRILNAVIPKEVTSKFQPPLVYSKDNAGNPQVVPRIEVSNPILYHIMKSEGIECDVETPAFDLLTLIDLLPNFTIQKIGNEFEVNIEEGFTSTGAIKNTDLLKALSMLACSLYAKRFYKNKNK